MPTPRSNPIPSHPTPSHPAPSHLSFFAASINPLLVLYVADLFPASMRASAVGLWQTSQQVGGVAANTVASAVLSAKGWRAVFKVSGSVVAVFAPILTAVLMMSARKSVTETKPTKTTKTTKTAKEQPPAAVVRLASWVRRVGLAEGGAGGG